MLSTLAETGRDQIYSHELANLSGVTAAQVRRDLMNIEYSGSPTRGYNIRGLINHINGYLDSKEPQHIALIGIGRVGQALIAYFANRNPNLSIVAAFDINPTKVGRVTNGCRCYPLDQFEQIVRQENIDVAILAVPAQEAQAAARQAIAAGVKGILNFAPVRLRVGSDVYVEDVDFAVCMEKVAFFARHNNYRRELIS